jgi:hypothetical protein
MIDYVYERVRDFLARRHTTRTIALNSKNLEGGIEALSSAARAFQLTRFESRTYNALMASGVVVVWSFCLIVLTSDDPRVEAFKGVRQLVPPALVFASFVALPLAFIVGTISLALNVPPLRKLYRERARLKELGISSLSKSLWKERRRSRWGWLARFEEDRGRDAQRPEFAIGLRYDSLNLMVVFSALGVLLVAPTPEKIEDWIYGALFSATIAVLIFIERYLRNQRERKELTARAKELKKVLEGLRQSAGKAEVVSVSSELLEQAAKIESAQIAKEREDAILESVAGRPIGYAITFDRDAAEQRATLDMGDRVELEDLVAHLSIEGSGKLKAQAGAVAPPEEATRRDETKSKRVEIEYVIDQPSRGIRIIAVRPALIAR